jgi:hypothetical protein
MVAEYQYYHGAVLHELVLQIGGAVTIESRDIHGRPDAYLVQGRIGLLIKHSAKRLTPWTFTFRPEHLLEVQSLCSQSASVFTCLVCADDGIACVPIQSLIAVLDSSGSEQAWIRVERRPGAMYRVSGAKGETRYKLARGVDAIVDALKQVI